MGIYLIATGHGILRGSLSVVQVETFDLIVSDINMPAPNGIDFGMVVRKFNSSVPIFYFSAEVDGSSTYASVINQIGNATYIDKDIGLLLRSIKECRSPQIKPYPSRLF